MSAAKKYAFVWITLALFFFSLAAHWGFGWLSFVEESRQHGAPPHFGDYAIQMARDTFENWQSEFLQLIWQVAGLAFLLCVGSPQSKEQGERLEAKLDYLLDQTEGGRRLKQELDQRLQRT